MRHEKAALSSGCSGNRSSRKQPEQSYLFELRLKAFRPKRVYEIALSREAQTLSMSEPRGPPDFKSVHSGRDRPRWGEFECAAVNGRNGQILLKKSEKRAPPKIARLRIEGRLRRLIGSPVDWRDR